MSGTARRTVGAIACFAAAALLALLALDIARWQGALAAGDVRYRAAPNEPDLWQPDEALPLGSARYLLGVDDDLEFRDALRTLRLGRIERATISDPEVELLRASARSKLRAIADRDGDRRRRSRALGLLGTISFASALGEVQDRGQLLREAVATFQEAIAVDPSNAEAKANLERALQRGRGLQATTSAGGSNPTPGGRGSRGAGAGDPGSGY